LGDRAQIGGKGITTRLYGIYEHYYPFGENLYVFNYATRSVYLLRSRADLTEYLEKVASRHKVSCRGREGFGDEDVF
jgi:hypothetical protein